MKATFPRKELAKAIKTVDGVIPSRTTMDILKNVLISVDHSGVATITGSDSTSTVVAKCLVEDFEPGECLISETRLRDIVATLDGDSVDLTESDQSVTVKSDRAKFRIQGENPTSYPPFSAKFPDAYIRINGDTFARELRRTVPFCLVVNENPALGGVCFEFKDGGLKLMSTARIRISCCAVEFESVGNPEIPQGRPSVPQSVAQLLCRSIDSECSVDIAFTGNSAMFRVGDTIFSTQLLGGKFPALDVPLSFSYDADVEIVCEPFLAAMNQAQIMTSEESSGVVFSLSEGKLTLSGESGSGQSTTEVPITFNGDDASFVVHPKTLASAVRLIGDKTFKLSFCQRAVRIIAPDGWIYFESTMQKEAA